MMMAAVMAFGALLVLMSPHFWRRVLAGQHRRGVFSTLNNVSIQLVDSR